MLPLSARVNIISGFFRLKSCVIIKGDYFFIKNVFRRF